MPGSPSWLTTGAAPFSDFETTYTSSGLSKEQKPCYTFPSILDITGATKGQ